MYDEWDEYLVRVERMYGRELAKKLSDMIDNNRVKEVNFILEHLIGE